MPRNTVHSEHILPLHSNFQVFMCYINITIQKAQLYTAAFFACLKATPFLNQAQCMPGTVVIVHSSLFDLLKLDILVQS